MSTFIDFDALKKAVTIEQVIALLQLSLQPTGNQLRGCCPIHRGSDPRDFVVTPAKGLFYCFKCKGGGDMIKLYALIKDVDQKSAALAIQTQLVESSDQDSAPDESQKMEASNGEVSEPTQPEAFPPLTYLQPEHASVQALGLSAATAKCFGAGYAPKGTLRGRLAIPVHNSEGILLGYCGRAVDEQQPMLTFPKNFHSEQILFNAHRCVPDSIIDLRHDPLDILLAYECGIESNIVAFMTERISALQIGQLALFLDKQHCCL